MIMKRGSLIYIGARLNFHIESKMLPNEGNFIPKEIRTRDL